VLFGFGPVFALVIEPRLVRRGLRPRMRNSVLGTDAALVVIAGALWWMIGWKDVLIVGAPATLLAGSVGTWLFYGQRRFEDAYREGRGEVEPCRRGAARELPSEAGEALAVLRGQRRPASCPPPRRTDSDYKLQRAHDANRCSPRFRRARAETVFGPSG
jgi:omega-6 fatty acid desaturase (delta-12 desaturase)